MSEVWERHGMSEVEWLRMVNQALAMSRTYWYAQTVQLREENAALREERAA